MYDTGRCFGTLISDHSFQRQTEILGDESSKNLGEIENRRIMKIVSVISPIVPADREGIRNHVQDGHVPPQKGDVVVFDEAVDENGTGKISIASFGVATRRR